MDEAISNKRCNSILNLPLASFMMHFYRDAHGVLVNLKVNTTTEVGRWLNSVNQPAISQPFQHYSGALRQSAPAIIYKRKITGKGRTLTEWFEASGDFAISQPPALPHTGLDGVSGPIPRPNQLFFYKYRPYDRKSFQLWLRIREVSSGVGEVQRTGFGSLVEGQNRIL